MTNPVKQNAGQIPLNTQNFFEGDGKTVSAPWRAFLRNVSSAIGTPGGGGDSPGLVNQVKAQGEQIEALFALESSTASAIAIGALLARIGFLEQSAVAVVPMPATTSQSSLESVSVQRVTSSFPDALMAAVRPQSLVDQPVYAPPAQYLKAQSNLSEIGNPATARTNLGLGTIATQAANAVAITGGSVNGTPVGASSPSTVAATSISANAGVVITETTNAHASLTIDGSADTNGANVKLIGTGVTTPSKTMRAFSGVWQLLNDAYSAIILQVDNSGNLTAAGGLSFSPATTTTAPSAGAAGALPATPTGYFTATIGGTARKVAYY